VFVRLGKVFVVFVLVMTLVAHWALLQTVAWTTMLASNLKYDSFHQAMTMTFDGNHPCPICKAIAAAKKSERKNQSTTQNQRLDFLFVHGNIVLIAPPQVEIASQNSLSESFLSKPPVPPPRGFLI